MEVCTTIFMRYFYLLLVSTCTHYAIYGILLKVSEPLSWEERFSVLKDTCNGLVYLHDGRMKTSKGILNLHF